MFVEDVTQLAAAETLAATGEWHALQRESEVKLLQLAVHYADLFPSPARVPDDQPGGERGVVYGGAGCPAIAEFAVAEFAAMLGVTSESGARFIGQALALRHRLPLTWARVESGQATAWKARLIATACLPLSVEAAALVDARVAGIVDSLSAIQVSNIVKASIWDADPAAARAASEQKVRERGVWPGRSDEHGTTKLFAKAATGDVIRFDAIIAQIADGLAAMGDTDPLDLRRAKALGILADPAFAHELLEVAQYLATSQTPTEPSEQGEGPARAKSTGLRDHGGADAAPAGASAPNVDRESAGADGERTGERTGEPAQAADIPSAGDAPSTDDRRQIDSERADELQADEVTRDGQPAADLFLADEPGPDAEADRDAPDPSQPGHPLDPPPPPSRGKRRGTAEETVRGMDFAARRDLAARLAAIKEAADTATCDPGESSVGGDADGPSPGDTTGRGPRRRARRRPGRTKIYLHITDETLLAGGGVTRVEGFGPVFAAKLAELLGHDHIDVQPVIDLKDHLSVNAYEIPRRIRERVKLTYPVEQFPFGAGETTNSTDLDHVMPFDPTGPPGQTSTSNLRPLRRFSHRVKTRGGWKVRPIDGHALVWTTRHGFKFRVDHTGTHRITDEEEI
ncbi:hypothetical protein GCM10009744_04150 [Kribbella alba]|uniref:DUF222 domain-containing protein n=1 Tax=Kribbella alba TaxID=190197 RepID=A0ABN2EWU6_9ACTN